MSGLTKTLEGYKINRLEHSLQTATRALNDKANNNLRKRFFEYKHSLFSVNKHQKKYF